jgi:hypothetical protein
MSQSQSVKLRVIASHSDTELVSGHSRCDRTSNEDSERSSLWSWDCRFPRRQEWRWQPSGRTASIIRAMMAVRTSETSVYVNKPTRRYIPEGRHLQSVRASPWASLRASEPDSRSASEGVWHNSSQSLLRWGATSRSGKPERASYELRYCTRGSDSTGFTCYFHRGTKSRWLIFVYSGCHRMEPAAIFFFIQPQKEKKSEPVFIRDVYKGPDVAHVRVCFIK